MVICCGSHKLVQVLVQEERGWRGVSTSLLGLPKLQHRWWWWRGRRWGKTHHPFLWDYLLIPTLLHYSRAQFGQGIVHSHTSSSQTGHYVDGGGWDGSLAAWTGAGWDCTSPQLMLPHGMWVVGSDILVSWTKAKKTSNFFFSIEFPGIEKSGLKHLVCRSEFDYRVRWRVLFYNFCLRFAVRS